MQRFNRSTLAATAAFGLLTAVGLVHGRDSAPDKPFSFDPLCRFGRLSDGKGFVIRCLTEAEQKALKDGLTEKPETKEEAKAEEFEVALGPIKADTGAFPKGVESLNKGMTKYRACMEEHGGLSAAQGTVDVRFLVRGRGRAEGAVAKRHSGMSAAAAKCIADVVDRRFVGYPDQEMVGATLIVTVKKR